MIPTTAYRRQLLENEAYLVTLCVSGRKHNPQPHPASNSDEQSLSHYTLVLVSGRGRLRKEMGVKCYLTREASSKQESHLYAYIQPGSSQDGSDDSKQNTWFSSVTSFVSQMVSEFLISPLKLK